MNQLEWRSHSQLNIVCTRGPFRSGPALCREGSGSLVQHPCHHLRLVPFGLARRALHGNAAARRIGLRDAAGTWGAPSGLLITPVNKNDPLIDTLWCSSEIVSVTLRYFSIASFSTASLALLRSMRPLNLHSLHSVHSPHSPSLQSFFLHWFWLHGKVCCWLAVQK